MWVAVMDLKVEQGKGEQINQEKKKRSAREAASVPETDGVFVLSAVTPNQTLEIWFGGRSNVQG